MTPLPQSMFITGIIGFIASAIYTYSGRISITWGFAFMLVFMIIFLASVVSITPSGKDFKEFK